jgi:hypothetical protein
VTHKEPDHIDRNGEYPAVWKASLLTHFPARTALLVHLLMHTPQPQLMTPPRDVETMLSARDLWTALEDKKFEFKGDRWPIITEIITFREQVEIFEAGGYGMMTWCPGALASVQADIACTIDLETVVFVPDFSESSRSSKSGTDAEMDDIDVQLPDQLDARIKEEGEDETPTPPSTRPPSPSQEQSTDAQQPLKSEEAVIDEVQESDDNQTMEQESVAFHPSTTELDTVHPDHDLIGMTVDPRPFERDQKADQSQLRLQRYLAQGPKTFRTQASSRQQDLMFNSWLPAESPSGFLPPGYSLEGNQILSADDFHMDELGLMHHSRQSMSLHPAHSMPIIDAMAYQDFSTTAPRPLPVRTMSTPHSALMGHAHVHGLGLLQQNYFSGGVS